jgi:glycosyltransferase involved in cell wall biosynthesis
MERLGARSLSKPRVVVLIPCYNEAAAVRQVVKDFRVALPDARIYVYDNNSSDGTARIAAEAGAVVRFETRQGKGHVVRRMLSETDADVYVMVDGDGTYDASTSAEMVRALLANRLAMVVGRRVHESNGAYRRGHVFGNRTLTNAVELLFGRTFKDILSGYRVFSRAFVKSFPVTSRGFEIETELTVHALTLNLPAQEIESCYRVRPAGSQSKLRTYQDGFRILGMIVRLFRTERPQLFYSLIGGLLLLSSVSMAIPIVITFLETGLVPRFPTAILASAVAVSSLLSFACGLILDTVTQGRREAKMLSYMATTRDQDSCVEDATEVTQGSSSHNW